MLAALPQVGDAFGEKELEELRSVAVMERDARVSSERRNGESGTAPALDGIVRTLHNTISCALLTRDADAYVQRIHLHPSRATIESDSTDPSNTVSARAQRFMHTRLARPPSFAQHGKEYGRSVGDNGSGMISAHNNNAAAFKRAGHRG